MWPFKKRVVVPWEDIAANLPLAPCGMQADHWRWIKLEGMACPRCLRARQALERAKERDELADAIARRVAERIASMTQSGSTTT